MKTTTTHPSSLRRRVTLGWILSLTVTILFSGSALAQKADKVLVIKKQRRMILQKNGKTLKTYSVAFGSNPSGHKKQQGDGRTPEGSYSLVSKNSQSKFYKSIKISYPNAKDRASASKRGVSPGGDIYIHGTPNGYGGAGGFMKLANWTQGCIAVTNGEMDEIWRMVDTGTPIEIRP